MGRQGRWAVVVAGAAIVGAVAIGTSSASADLAVAARWEMNEAAGATLMADGGPSGLSGDIGDEIDVGGGSYRWSDINWFTYPATVERIVVVDDDPALNPGLESFSVELRFRSGSYVGNIVQKGQNGNPTGAWKLEQPSGFAGCAFKDANGVLKGVTGRTLTSDDEWHVVRCELDRDFGDHGGLRLLVDGVVDQVNVFDEPFGAVANDQPMVVGGKINCDQIAITCDYFMGEIDYIEIRSGASPPSTTTTTTSTTTTTTTVASGGPVIPGGIFGGADAATPAVRGARVALD